MIIIITCSAGKYGGRALIVSSLSLASSSSSSCFSSSTTFPFSPRGGGENECDLLLLLERESDLKWLGKLIQARYTKLFSYVIFGVWTPHNAHWVFSYLLDSWDDGESSTDLGEGDFDFDICMELSSICSFSNSSDFSIISSFSSDLDSSPVSVPVLVLPSSVSLWVCSPEIIKTNCNDCIPWV